MTTIYLSLSAQVAKSTFFMKSLVVYQYKFLHIPYKYWSSIALNSSIYEKSFNKVHNYLESLPILLNKDVRTCKYIAQIY